MRPDVTWPAAALQPGLDQIWGLLFVEFGDPAQLVVEGFGYRVDQDQIKPLGVGGGQSLLTIRELLMRALRAPGWTLLESDSAY